MIQKTPIENYLNPELAKTKPNLQEFMQKGWKWIRYTNSKEMLQEARCWKQEELVIDPIYSMIITECMHATQEYNVPSLKILSNYYNVDMVEMSKNKELRKGINCIDQTERFMIQKFKTEYLSLFDCKNKCQLKDPHGVIAQQYRGKCYLDCGRVFNNKQRAFSFRLQKRYQKDGFVGLGNFQEESYTTVIEKGVQQFVCFN